tara:strand:- start:1161 stop:1505 length:345 start_codon:yes stop_codon:yes gene_type:complete
LEQLLSPGLHSRAFRKDDIRGSEFSSIERFIIARGGIHVGIRRMGCARKIGNGGIALQWRTAIQLLAIHYTIRRAGIPIDHSFHERALVARALITTAENYKLTFAVAVSCIDEF